MIKIEPLDLDSAASSSRFKDDALDDETTKEAQTPPREGSLPASFAGTEDPKHDAYPVRVLRDRYALSPAVAKIIATELHMVDAA
jgi:hypothetical protein